MRLIDADALRERIITRQTEISYEDAWALTCVDNAPTIEPGPQWISVTERLPKEYGNYLISIHGEDEPDIGTINPNDKRGWSLCDANGFYWASDKKLIVTAWMLLPGSVHVRSLVRPSPLLLMLQRSGRGCEVSTQEDAPSVRSLSGLVSVPGLAVFFCGFLGFHTTPAADPSRGRAGVG